MMTTNREDLQKIFEAALRETDAEEKAERARKAANAAPMRRMHCVTAAPAALAVAPEPVVSAKPKAPAVNTATATDPALDASFHPDFVGENGVQSKPGPSFKKAEADPVSIPAPTFNELPDELRDILTHMDSTSTTSRKHNGLIVAMLLTAITCGVIIWYLQA